MQGFTSYSVYWVAFCGAIHGSLFIKNRLVIAWTRVGDACRRLLCEAHKHSPCEAHHIRKAPYIIQTWRVTTHLIEERAHIFYAVMR